MPDTRPGGDEQSAPLIWRSLPLRLALVAIPLALTTTVLVFNVGATIRLIAALTLGVSLLSPANGLLLTAAIAPLGQLIAIAIGAADFRIGEVIVLAFFVGWLLRGLPDRRGPRVATPAAGWLFAATIAASIAGLSWQLGRYPGELPATINEIVHGARRISADIALRLSRYFGLSDHYRFNLQALYDLQTAKEQLRDELDAITPVAA